MHVLGPDFTAVSANDLPAYRKTKPRTSRTGFCLAALNEFIEYRAKFRFWYAGTFIGNTATKRRSSVRQAIISDGDLNFPPALRELYSI